MPPPTPSAANGLPDKAASPSDDAADVEGITFYPTKTKIRTAIKRKPPDVAAAAGAAAVFAFKAFACACANAAVVPVVKMLSTAERALAPALPSPVKIPLPVVVCVVVRLSGAGLNEFNEVCNGAGDVPALSSVAADTGTDELTSESSGVTSPEL
jgi:hypothetical protein